MEKDEDDVHKVMDTIESWMSFFISRDPIDLLSNIASGMKTTDDIADHLLPAKQKGNDVFTTFIGKELQQVTSTCSLNCQMPNYRRSKT